VLLERDLLAIYLSDHLAGATTGIELARRARGANEGSRYGAGLARIADEIEQDREDLREVMTAVDVSPVTAKQVLAWGGEKFGRLKLNGQIRGYSPLSRLVELEGLIIGVTGKLQLWRALSVAAAGDPRLARFDFDALVERAEDQRSRLADLHAEAAAEAFGGDPVAVADAPGGESRLA
jgi:hypothetical protein